jgi:hypothetical protein
MKVRVGMEASGQARWFERLLAELNLFTSLWRVGHWEALAGAKWRRR